MSVKLVKTVFNIVSTLGLPFYNLIRYRLTGSCTVHLKTGFRDPKYKVLSRISSSFHSVETFD